MEGFSVKLKGEGALLVRVESPPQPPHPSEAGGESRVPDTNPKTDLGERANHKRGLEITRLRLDPSLSENRAADRFSTCFGDSSISRKLKEATMDIAALELFQIKEGILCNDKNLGCERDDVI